MVCLFTWIRTISEAFSYVVSIEQINFIWFSPENIFVKSSTKNFFITFLNKKIIFPFFCRLKNCMAPTTSYWKYFIGFQWVFQISVTTILVDLHISYLYFVYYLSCYLIFYNKWSDILAWIMPQLGLQTK